MIEYSNDYQWWDNTEAVTITLVRESGTTTVSVAIGSRSDISTRELASSTQGVFQAGDVRWKIPVILLGISNRLLPDDLITDASGVVWNVRSVSEVRVGTSRLHWEAICAERK